MSNEELKKAYNINVKFFGRIPIKLEEIKMYKYESRKEFNNIYKKYHHKKPESKDIVGFVNYRLPFWKKFFLGTKFQIFIISENIFEQERVFDRGYYFNVLIHEVAHIFLMYNKILNEIGECICYYVANQQKFHKNEYLLGKKIFTTYKEKFKK